MQQLTPHDVTTMFLALAVLLGSAKIAGELVQKFNQPAVLGEIIAGIFLGPSLLGSLEPKLYSTLFPTNGAFPLVLNAVSTIGVVLFLLTAGIEVDLSSVFRQGRSALVVSFFGVLVPFVVGTAAAGIFPKFMGMEPGADRTIFAFFVGTALSISALPVVAKILMDLNLFRSEVGMLVLSSAMFNDLVGWILFSLVLGMMSEGSASLPKLRHTIFLTVAFVLIFLTVGRWLIHKALPLIQAHTSWPGGVLAFIFTLTLASAAFTEHAGIHAVFGAFIAGIAIGDSSHLRKRTREHIHEIVTNVFAPLFFVSIGLQANFVKNFSLGLMLILLTVACAGKVLGIGWGARLGGLDRRTSWVVAFAMNARGAMEIILGLLAIQSGLIKDRMFVALVLVALITSLIAGPSVNFLVERRRAIHLKDYLSGKLFARDLQGVTRSEVIKELCDFAAQSIDNSPDHFFPVVWDREVISGSGLANGVAVPHARIHGVDKPIVVVGIHRFGVDFDARDGKPARLIVLIITGDNQSQIELLGDVGRLFRHQETVEQALNARTFLEFMAAVNAPAED
jgi:Kef-type K+ transport system membrane component KefB/mannitol/fructose-specific phosphotransferase system IIA component (Ntr-type)